ncbi:MAG: hypothetical protein CSA38_05225 [Flavobacteriales bacterium]|nr:MAG: hypothetical protein CSA38_05225 [Flavobacteriales bacterium]
MPKIGFGLRIRDIQYKNIIGKEKYENNHWTCGGANPFVFSLNTNQQGVKTNFNFNLALKLVYRF